MNHRFTEINNKDDLFGHLSVRCQRMFFKLQGLIYFVHFKGTSKEATWKHLNHFLVGDKINWKQSLHLHKSKVEVIYQL